MGIGAVAKQWRTSHRSETTVARKNETQMAMKLSRSAVKKSCKSFASEKAGVEYHPRSGRPLQNDLSEFVRTLIKES
jgi:hypothetical protein